MDGIDLFTKSFLINFPILLSLMMLNQFNASISDETTFSIAGNANLTEGNHVWSTPVWSEEFIIKFDIIVDTGLSSDFTNVFRVTTTTGNHGICGDRIPTLFVSRNPKHFGFRFFVNGENNYGIETTNYVYEMNKPYRIEISQRKNSNGDSIYKIIINGETFHEVINTTPTKFMDAMLYLSDQFYDTFAPFGRLANFKISSVLKWWE